MALSHSHSTHLDADSEEDEHFGERQEKIYAACSLLIQLGFDRNEFTIKNIYKHGYTDNEFLELIKPLASITDMDMDESDIRYLSKGARDCSVKLEPYNFLNSVDFAKWLYEADGKRTLEFLSNKKNIVRKELTTAEISLARMFIEYGASRKLERDRICEEIEELSIQQKKLEMEYESIEEELERKLGPLYEYNKEPKIYELLIEAYKLYEEDCKSKGISPIPKSDKGFEKAMELFGDVAKERCNQLVNYLNDPVRQKKVKDFFKGKIYRMEHVTDGGETTIVYKFATDVCEEISSGNIVYKHESEVREENSDGRKPTIIYKFEPDVCEKISNVPPLPDSRKAPKQKAKRQEQEHKGAPKKMKSMTLG
ncbi:MEI1 protein [Trifolium medium]|uniref:MEI1 protein n=1 Tax=Trifolium medium TaxID=97028 RepID=A0A392MCX6_9FABA|nr:MEI1 protein [Trifolium medium]